MSELKSCPFCGSDAAVFVKDDESFPYYVQCLNDDCACKTDNFKQYGFAIESWNMRVKDEKKGKWVKDGHHIQCNQCGISICDKDREGDVLPKKFCPNCGSYNGGEEE